MPSLRRFCTLRFNNILVMLVMFISGLFFGVGSVIGIPISLSGLKGISGLVGNAVMVGAFFGFFRTYNVLEGALPVVMLHGTLELSALVITCAAGMMLGNGILFPRHLQTRPGPAKICPGRRAHHDGVDPCRGHGRVYRRLPDAFLRKCPGILRR